ncbi:MAG: acetyl-CoA carboxylase biotin carboxylase subunit [Bacteroidetes bacterium]|nr:acetyl-CoA carboxylase biotin carboxylase subunit [Bacteroidota bacterium]MCW5895984.1 acetyl-CoA carboxylase biotin carboxylase subunit [Bacteroidota bacterium]
MFNKVLIANRGEIALRIIRVCKQFGIKTVAVYSQADRDSLHVKFADEAVCIGPPPGKESYLKIPRIIAAAEITAAEAIHPGYGFLAENAQFAEICKTSGIKFIGPSPEMISAMGDKALAKDTMKKAGVPVVPGSEGEVDDVDEAKKVAKEIGFPVIIKAVAGGGGRGMRIVREEQELETAFMTARHEAETGFSNPAVYIEKFVEQPRHIEIQVFGDQHGNVVHFGERDCSVQRRHQKLIEESPSPFVDEALRQKMGDAAVKGCEAVNYEGAGTIEFLVDKEKNFYFMEMNTRIQVEHPVTEEVTAHDLIKLQLRVAAGEKLPRRKIRREGHAIECRINAEDPANGFRPNPGRVTDFHMPGGFGVRVDTHCYAGYVVPPFYDSLLAKLVVYAQTREGAIQKMAGALDEFTIQGIKTTIPFHRQVMHDSRFISGKFDTSFLETFQFNAEE